MKPASSIIEAFGGPTTVAKIVGVHRTRVSMWKVSKEKGGTGGLIPMKHALVLLEEARRRGVEVAPEDFFEVQKTHSEAS